MYKAGEKVEESDSERVKREEERKTSMPLPLREILNLLPVNN